MPPAQASGIGDVIEPPPTSVHAPLVIPVCVRVVLLALVLGHPLSRAQAADTNAASPASAPAVGAASRPVPRSDATSLKAHEQLLQKARQGRIDTYFVGDSIFRRWGCSDPQYAEFLGNWRTNFHGWNAANFGWGSDRVEHVLWRLQNGEFDGVEPKVVVLLAGTNNLQEPAATRYDQALVEDVSEGLRTVVEWLRHRAPRTVVVVLGVLPRTDVQGGTSLMPNIRAINTRIAALADGVRVRYLDLASSFADGDGRVLPGLMGDGVHPTVLGYQRIADALRPIFTEVLGPRADRDLAPPPTGDPSIQK